MNSLSKLIRHSKLVAITGQTPLIAGYIFKVYPNHLLISLGFDTILNYRLLRQKNKQIRKAFNVMKYFKPNSFYPLLYSKLEVKTPIHQLNRFEILEYLKAANKEKFPVLGRILSRVRGGYTVGLGGFKAFLPGSQILKSNKGKHVIGELKDFFIIKLVIENEVEARLMKEPLRYNMVVSRKPLYILFLIREFSKELDTYFTPEEMKQIRAQLFDLVVQRRL